MDLSEQILLARKLPREFVAVPEWQPTDWQPGPDGSPFGLYVRKPSGADMEAWDNSNATRDKTGEVVEVKPVGAAARLLVKILEDGAGKRVFTDAQVGALNDLDYDVLNRLAGVALRLSGRKTEAAKKNSEATPPEGSS